MTTLTLECRFFKQPRIFKNFKLSRIIVKKLTVFLSRIAVSWLALSGAAHAGFIDLGSAENQVFASSTSIILGSEAHVFGNVSANNYLGLASGVVIEGNACSNHVNMGAGVTVVGESGNATPCHNLEQIGQDITSATTALSTFGQGSASSLTQSTSLLAGNYWFEDLELQSGESLVINGNQSSTAIINISGHAKLGSGSSIELLGGILAENVFFNFTDNIQFNSFEIGAADISGTFISASRNFILGDGATLNDTRFLTNGTIVANVQDVKFDSVKVPEPTLFSLLLLATAALIARRKH